ncbi:MAG: M16 family metallopeptidase [Arcticibacter sp.]
MKNLFRLLLCALLLAPVVSTAQKKPAAPVKITSVEGITEYQLANGLKVLLFPDPSKSTITVNITYLVGSRHEGYGESGMAHLLEHMVFKGTPRHPNIPQELTSHGARPNGTTWLDRTNYFETFNATEENLRWALDMEADRMINSFIAKKDLESEFSVVRNEFESGENDPSGVLMERVMSTAYLWHNYGKSTIGSREDIERVPIENLQAFYKKYYQPDNAVLMVTGKIDEAKTLDLVNEYFGTIAKPTRVLQPTYTVEPTQDGERHVVLNRVGDVQVASMGYHVPAGAHPDFPAIDLLTDILTNEPSGRLYKALVETKMATSVGGFAFELRDPGFAYFTADVLKEKSLDEVMNTMKSIMDNLKDNPATPAEVDRAKNKSLKFFEQTYNNSERVGLTLSEYIAKGDWRLFFHQRDMVEKVTAADVNRVAVAYFKPSNRTTGKFIPDPAPDRAVITAAPDPAVLLKDYKGKQALKQAEDFEATPDNIAQRTVKGEISGGAKYAFLKKSTRGGTVNVSMTLRIGSAAAMQGKSTVADMTAAMLRRGTARMNMEQINDSFDKMKSSVNIFGSGQTVNISITTTAEQLENTLKLVQEILRTPSFPQAELSKLVDEELADIEKQRSEPQSIAGLEFSRIMKPYPKTDFRYSMDFDEQAASVKAVTIDQIKKLYQDMYNSTNATVAIVGDFDDKAILGVLKQMLADWKSPVAYERAADTYTVSKPGTKKINTPDKTNAMMMAGLNVEFKDDNDDMAAMVIGNYILGGGFLNSRLAVRIRQKEGISYGVGSQFQPGQLDNSGMFVSYAIYNPENSVKLVACLREELQRIVNEGITEQELKDASSGYLQSRKVSRSQDRELVGRLNSYLFLNRDIFWDRDLEYRVTKLDVKQVNEALKRWIKPDNIFVVEAGEFEKKK